jgi:tetratricopeptide (TPR) repeat protein
VPDSADHPKPKVQAVEEAIQLALAFRWEDALQLNQELLERFGPDEDSYNRLGKALMELGRREEAMAAYQSTIEVNPLNQIAARQLTKLGDLSATKGKVARVSASLDSAFFIEEPGKTALTRVVPDEELGKVQFAPGDPVELSYSPAHVTVRTLRGETLGTLEPRMAQRLRRMVDSGNRYGGAVTHVDGTSVQIIVRETYQAPELAGTVSFPTRKSREMDYRPYAKETLLVRGEEPITIDDEDGEPVTQRPARVSSELEDGFAEFGELNESAEAPDADDADTDGDEDAQPEDEY